MVEYKLIKLPSDDAAQKRIQRLLGDDFISFFRIWSGFVKNPDETKEYIKNSKMIKVNKKDFIIDNFGKLGDLPNSNVSSDITKILWDVLKCFTKIAKSPYYDPEKFELTKEHLAWIKPIKEILRGAKND